MLFTVILYFGGKLPASSKRFPNKFLWHNIFVCNFSQTKCRRRYEQAFHCYNQQFRKEIKQLEAMQPSARDAMRLHRLVVKSQSRSKKQKTKTRKKLIEFGTNVQFMQNLLLQLFLVTLFCHSHRIE